MTRITIQTRSRDTVAYVQGQPQKWAPGDSRVGAIETLIKRYPELAKTPCASCGEAVGTRNVIVDEHDELIHLTCYHREQVEPLR